MDNVIYITLNDGTIGKIIGTCNCSACQDRGSPEITVVDLDGSWLDSIAVNKISRENLLYCGSYATKAVDSYIEYLKEFNTNYTMFKNHIANMLEKDDRI
jgi:hypothetical protein